MDIRKGLALVLTILVFAAGAVAYGGSGPVSSDGTPTSACNDGDDNDNDGKTDGPDDPGCNEPYYADDSEASVYDLDASWTFSGNAAPTTSGPSIFYGWKAQNGEDIYKDRLSSGDLDEAYVDLSSSTGWGGGEMKYAGPLSITDDGTADRNTFKELIDTPGENTGAMCGDGIQNDGETTTNCPQDVHLPETDTSYTVPNSNGLIDCQDASTVSESASTTGSSDMVPGSERTTGENYEIVKVYCNTYTKSNSITVQQNPSTVTDENINSGLEDTCNQGFYCETDSCSVDSTTTYTDYDKDPDGDDLTLSWDEYEYVASTSGSGSDFSYTITKTKVDSHTYSKNYDDWDSSGSYDVDTVSCTDTSFKCLLKEGCTSTYDEEVDGTSYDVDPSDNEKTVDVELVKINDTVEYDLYSSDYKTKLENNINSRGDTTVSLDGTDFKIGGGSDSTDQGNDPSASRTTFVVWADSSGNPMWGHVSSSTVVDADGPDGQGDGYAAISKDTDKYGGTNNWMVHGQTDNFLAQEIVDGSESNDFITVSDIEGDQSTISCDTKDKCMASIDTYTKETGWNSDGDSSWNYQIQGPFDVSTTYSVCKMHKTLSGDWDLTCSREGSGGGGTLGGGGGDGDVCGDDSDEYYAYMEGPEVDPSKFDNNVEHYQACLDTGNSGVTKSSCVLHGNVVPEGHVANVASPDYESDVYEEGGTSPDWEVCLDMEGTGIGNEGDRMPGDNKDDTDSKEDYGGEWYDPDNDDTTDYLNNHNPDLVNNGDDTDPNDIAYYYRTNPNPDHSTHNPSGGDSGIPLEDDCEVSECDDTGAGNSNIEDSYVYTPFERGVRVEDYHPQFQDGNDDNARFFGYVNKLEEDSNQFEPNMDTIYNIGGGSWSDFMWSDSNGSEISADQWAITEDLTYAISNTGKAYLPGDTYYKPGVSERTGPDSPSKSKYQKVFGNSFVDVVSSSYNNNGVSFNVGDGVWIDPDTIKAGWTTDVDYKASWPGAGNYRDTSEFGSWKDKLRYSMDLTGKDAGLGFYDKDTNGIQPWSVPDGPSNSVVLTDGLWFQTSDFVEEPMCGDDRYEYFLEEVGESLHSERFTGGYACADTRSVCVDKSGSSVIYSTDEYRNTDEPDENAGRYKRDSEVCKEASGLSGRPDDQFATWYDQDYGDTDGDGSQDTCNDNSLYGPAGVRWIDSSYVNTYSDVVKNGIDDDWNSYLEEDLGMTPVSSPVDTGSPNSSIATVGFCAGDDGSEYIITQECSTSLCETDRSVLGVVKNQDACIFDSSGYPRTLSSYSGRNIYQPGEKVEFRYEGDIRSMSCFNGKWYDKWPIVFDQEQVKVPFSQERTVSFRVINIDDQSRKFEVEMVDQPKEVYRRSWFTHTTSDSFEVTVGAQSAKSFDVQIENNNRNLIDDGIYDLRLTAEGVNSGVYGEDTLGVNFTKLSNKTGAGQSNNPETRNVPGIGMAQIAFIALMASATYFFLV